MLLTERAAPVDQQSQHLQLFVGDDRPQSAHAGADQGDGVRVGGVGLAALSGGEHPCPRRELRGHVDDVLASADELLGEQRSDPGGALDGPTSWFERGGPLEEPGSLMAVRFDAELTDDGLSVVDGGGGVGTLVRVDPDGDQGVLQAGVAGGCAAGGQT